MYGISGNNVEDEGGPFWGLAEKYLGLDVDAL